MHERTAPIKGAVLLYGIEIGCSARKSMRSLIFISAILLSPLFIYMSCKNTTSSPIEKCPDNVMCTQMFAMVAIKVTDKTALPVKLDDAYTVRIETKETIRPESQGVGNGNYIVLDDSYQKKLAKTTANFRFVGIKGGKEVVNELFTISADCCHISKQSGRTEVAIN